MIQDNSYKKALEYIENDIEDIINNHSIKGKLQALNMLKLTIKGIKQSIEGNKND